MGSETKPAVNCDSFHMGTFKYTVVLKDISRVKEIFCITDGDVAGLDPSRLRRSLCLDLNVAPFGFSLVVDVE